MAPIMTAVLLIIKPKVAIKQEPANKIKKLRVSCESSSKEARQFENRNGTEPILNLAAELLNQPGSAHEVTLRECCENYAVFSGPKMYCIMRAIAPLPIWSRVFCAMSDALY